MTQEEIIRMAQKAGLEDWTDDDNWVGHSSHLIKFAALVAAAKDAEHAEKLKYDIHSCGPTCQRYACVATRKAVAAEREAIAKMIEDAPKLVEFAANDKGGCLVCGFTPKMAAAAIRARGNT